MTENEKVFVNAFARTGQSMRAVRWAFRSDGAHNWTEGRVSDKADELLVKPTIRKAIDKARRRDALEEIMGARELIREWVMIATADPAELIHPVSVCCRHCHGEGGAFQWRDEGEWERDVARWQASAESDPTLPIPECSGGFGFDSTRPPNPECRQCDGVGQTVIRITDIHHLSVKARRLYRGMKQTQHGVEVLMHDQERARENLAKVMGIFTNPIQTVEVIDASAAKALTDEYLAAIIAGNKGEANVSNALREPDDEGDLCE